MLLDTADVAAMRAEMAAALPDTCQIARPLRLPDGAGGFSETYTVIATVPCRIASMGQTQTAARSGSAASWTVGLPAGTDVRESDRIVYGARKFEIGSILKFPHDLSVLLLCSEGVRESGR